VALALLCFAATVAFGSPTLLACTGLVLAVGPALSSWRRKPIEGVVKVQPGKVSVAGSAPIVARELRGSTSARRGGDVVLFLATDRDGGAPITLELQSDAEANQVRQALGIGHDGFGALSWATSPGSGAGTRDVLRAVAAITLATTTVIYAMNAMDEEGTLGLWGAIGIMVGMLALVLSGLMAIVAWFRPTLRMDRAGFAAMPWHTIHDARVDGEQLWLAASAALGVRHSLKTSNSDLRAMSDEDVANLVAAIKSAARRARGEGPRRREPGSRIDHLGRRALESGREWLARLDLEAQAIATGGYRGSAVERDDLVHTLEDPDVDHELRAAAARILLHIDPQGARPRVEQALATGREVNLVRKIRIAAEQDAEHGGILLDELEFPARSTEQAQRNGLSG
jgi:hypothetical protein